MRMCVLIPMVAGSPNGCCNVSWCKKSSNLSRNLFVALSAESVNFSNCFSPVSTVVDFFPVLVVPIGCSRIIIKCVWSLFKESWSRLRDGTLTS